MSEQYRRGQLYRSVGTSGEVDAFLAHPLVEKHLIGLWRFHELGRPRMWCATYCVDGNYYDVSGKRTPVGALRGVLQGVNRLLARKR